LSEHRRCVARHRGDRTVRYRYGDRNLLIEQTWAPGTADEATQTFRYARDGTRLLPNPFWPGIRILHRPCHRAGFAVPLAFPERFTALLRRADAPARRACDPGRGVPLQATRIHVDTHPSLPASRHVTVARVDGDSPRETVVGVQVDVCRLPVVDEPDVERVGHLDGVRHVELSPAITVDVHG
jgi:hypothetical protein